ncbi:MAG: hypothetical protein ABIJ46_04150 [bacterium]
MDLFFLLGLAVAFVTAVVAAIHFRSVERREGQFEVVSNDEIDDDRLDWQADGGGGDAPPRSLSQGVGNIPPTRIERQPGFEMPGMGSRVMFVKHPDADGFVEVEASTDLGDDPGTTKAGYLQVPVSVQAQMPVYPDPESLSVRQDGSLRGFPAAGEAVNDIVEDADGEEGASDWCPPNDAAGELDDPATELDHHVDKTLEEEGMSLQRSPSYREADWGSRSGDDGLNEPLIPSEFAAADTDSEEGRPPSGQQQRSNVVSMESRTPTVMNGPSFSTKGEVQKAVSGSTFRPASPPNGLPSDQTLSPEDDNSPESDD